MIRWGAIALLAAAICAPAVAGAQVCRRVCRPGEVRDANRCCIPRSRLEIRRGRGNVRVEADVARGVVGVRGKWRRVKFPVTLRRVVAGKHRVTIRAGKRTWRGRVHVRARKTVKLFASVAGRESLPNPAGEKRARAILDKALAAKGGAARLRKLSNVRYLAQVPDGVRPKQYMLTLVPPVTYYWSVSSFKAGKYRTETRSVNPGYVTASWFEGKVPKQKTRPATARDRAELWQFPDVVLLRHLEKGTRVALLPATTFAGVKVDVVQVARADGSARTRLYIGRQRHLLRGVQAIHADGGFAEAIELLGYRRVQGIAFAFVWRFHGELVRWDKVAVALSSGNKPRVPVVGVRGKKLISVETRSWVGRRVFRSKLNRDGVEDFYGVCHVATLEQGPSGRRTRSLKYYLCGVDGRNFTELFRVGPTPRALHIVALPRRRVAIVSKGGTLAVYSVASKREVWRATVKFNVREVCVNRKLDTLWLAPHRRPGVLVDVGKRSLRPHARPSWCKRNRLPCPEHRSAACLTRKQQGKLPVPPSFHLQYTLAAGGVRVGLGYARRPRRQPAAMAWKRDGTLLWSRRILPDARRRVTPSHVELVGNTLLIAYNDRLNASRLEARSARTGKRLWQAKLPIAAVHYLYASKRRVYVVGMHRGVVVYAINSGKHLGTFAQETARLVRPAP